jgi:hypothetical protein
MTCYHPLEAYWTRGENSSKRKITFSYTEAFQNATFPSANFIKSAFLPCGRCIGCRLSYSRQWAIRCVHEAQMHQNNCFVTFTFNPEELVKRENPFSLNVRDFQLFMKRLRKKHPTIRFFHSGEYGEKNLRPHYHALIFGYDFPDKKLFKKSKGHNLYTSEELQKLWPYGHTFIGDCNFHTSAYTARYIIKKINGDQAKDHYWRTNPETGEMDQIEPEYATMSRRPGIGYNWFQKYKTDVYPHDYVVINGFKVKPPRYYDNLLSEGERDQIKKKRMENYEDPDYEQLFKAEKVKISSLQQLLRDL